MSDTLTPIDDVAQLGSVPEGTVETAPENDDLRDFIAKQFEPTGDENAAPQRARDERGKFTKTEGAEPSDPSTPITDPDLQQGNVQERSTALEPPKGWSADARAKWAALDPSIQAEVMKREQDMDNGGRQWSEQRKTYDEMLSPVREMAQRTGVDDREVITRLIEASNWLERDPAGFIQAYAGHFGIDLSKSTGNQQPQARPDPMVAQLSQTVSRLEQSLTAREQAELNSKIEAFKVERPHFDKVRKDMGHLINADPNLTLEDAYDRAIWANPEVRAELIKQQTAAQTKQAQDAAQAAKSRNAASPKGSGPNANAPVPKKDYGDDLRSLVSDAFHGRI